MKNVDSLKTHISNSPKTPGGISKSLLTPCRRVGLSRNWKKNGPSPFISPLASSGDENKDKNEEGNSPASHNVNTANSDLNMKKTPSRNVALPRKRKSKTLLTVISSNENNSSTEPQSNILATNTKTLIDNPEECVPKNREIKEVSTPVRVKSKIKLAKKILSHTQPSIQDSETIENTCNVKECFTESEEVKTRINEEVNSKDKSPNELNKECIVVIQRKIFMDDMKNSVPVENLSISDKDPQHIPSQTLFDSDTDDLPLCQLNNVRSQSPRTVKDSQKVLETFIVHDNDDFVDHKSKIRKVDTVMHNIKQKKKIQIRKKIEKDLSQSFDDDEDFDLDNKRTILIRKTYEKVTKPSKAKSTGSITQKDIDELKARIELKKKILLAQTVTEDTKELRELIKKWQKGCQDALMELMDLMKRKFPEKSNMDYSEILETLHIPASLVGYDSENECFNTPDDANIILSHINDQ